MIATARDRGVFGASVAAVAGLLLAMMMTGCSVTSAPEAPNRLDEIERRLSALEYDKKLAKVTEDAKRIGKETGLDVSFTVETPWSPACLSWSKPGSSKRYSFCGGEIVERWEP